MVIPNLVRSITMLSHRTHPWLYLRANLQGRADVWPFLVDILVLSLAVDAGLT